MHPTTTQVLLAIGVAGLAIDSVFRYLRIRRSERGPFFGSARATHALFVAFVLSVGVMIGLVHVTPDSALGPIVVSWLVVASALTVAMVASERRRTAVRSTA